MPVNKRYWRARVAAVIEAMPLGEIFTVSDLDTFGTTGPTAREIGQYVRTLPGLEYLPKYSHNRPAWRRV